MPTMIFGLLKNKNFWIVLIVLGAITYHFITVAGLEVDVAELKIENIRLETDKKTLKQNETICIKTNEENQDVINILDKEFFEVEHHYIEIVKAKDAIIKTLRIDLDELSKPIDYPDEMTYEQCTIKIKTIKDMNKDETDYNTLNSLLNIGN